MKRTMQALIVAALLNGTCALADDPANVLSPQVTRADMYAGELGLENAVSVFPSSVDDAGIYVPSKSTYADQFVTERDRQARGESDPALSE
jgi:hypothetical protein